MGLFARKQNKATRTRPYLMACLAVFALIVQTFLPLSQALAAEASKSDEFQIICTVHGIVQVPVDQEIEPIVPTNAGPCTHCVMHVSQALFAPVKVAKLVLKVPEQHTLFVLTDQQSPASIWRGLPRPSRAPPASV